MHAQRCSSALGPRAAPALAQARLQHSMQGLQSALQHQALPSHYRRPAHGGSKRTVAAALMLPGWVLSCPATWARPFSAQLQPG